jgi:subtilase family serine protease
MATLSTTLSVSTSDATSDSLKLTVSDSLTVTVPSVNIARISVLHTGATQILDSSVATSNTYVYMKNLDTTNFVELKTDAGNAYAVLLPGEAVLLNVKASTGIEVQADTATCQIDYGYWTAS